MIDELQEKAQMEAEKVIDRVLGGKFQPKKERTIYDLHAEQSRIFTELKALYDLFEKAAPDANQLKELEAKEEACMRLADEMNKWVAGYVRRCPPKEAKKK